MTILQYSRKRPHVGSQPSYSLRLNPYHGGSSSNNNNKNSNQFTTNDRKSQSNPKKKNNKWVRSQPDSSVTLTSSSAASDTSSQESSSSMQHVPILKGPTNMARPYEALHRKRQQHHQQVVKKQQNNTWVRSIATTTRPSSMTDEEHAVSSTTLTLLSKDTQAQEHERDQGSSSVTAATTARPVVTTIKSRENTKDEASLAAATLSAASSASTTACGPILKGGPLPSKRTWVRTGCETNKDTTRTVSRVSGSVSNAHDSARWKRPPGNLGTSTNAATGLPVERVAPSHLLQAAKLINVPTTTATTASSSARAQPMPVQANCRKVAPNKIVSLSKVGASNSTHRQANLDAPHEGLTPSGYSEYKTSTGSNTSSEVRANVVKRPRFHDSHDDSNYYSRHKGSHNHRPRPPAPKRIRIDPSRDEKRDNDHCSIITNSNPTTSNAEEGATEDGIERASDKGKKKTLTDFAYRETSQVGGGKHARHHHHYGHPKRVPMGLVRVQPNKETTPICPTFLRGVPCRDVSCLKRHDVPEAYTRPICRFFQRQGMCFREDCRFRHVKVSAESVVCPNFDLLGFCEDEACDMKHERSEQFSSGNNNAKSHSRNNTYRKPKTESADDRRTTRRGHDALG